MKPLFSIIIPTYNTDIAQLKACIASVLKQSFEDYEICIYDDGSFKDEVLEYLQVLSDDSKVSVSLGKENRGVAYATNRALSMASGVYMCFLDHDDLLTPAALAHVKDAIESAPEALWFYSDEQIVLPDGETVSQVLRKPHFSPHLLLSNNYICHLLIVKKQEGDSLGWFREGFEGAHDHDLLLRLSERSEAIHIAEILYSWRICRSSILSGFSKLDAVVGRKKAIQSWMERQGITGTVECRNDARMSIEVELPRNALISIVIVYKNNLKETIRCLKSVLALTLWSNCEIVLVSDTKVESELLDYVTELSNAEKIGQLYATKKLHSRSIKHLPVDDCDMNVSHALNVAVSECSGDYFVLMDSETEIITRGWLTAMMHSLFLPQVGFVGALLLDENNTIRECGMSVGTFGYVRSLYQGQDLLQIRWQARLKIPHNVSACSLSLMLTSRSVWDSIGGLDSKSFPTLLNDVDFCLEIFKKGLRGLVDPVVQAVQTSKDSFDPSSSATDAAANHEQLQSFLSKWDADIQAGDRYVSREMAVMLIDHGKQIPRIRFSEAPEPRSFFPEEKSVVIGTIPRNWSAILLFGNQETQFNELRKLLLENFSFPLKASDKQVVEAVNQGVLNPLRDFVIDCHSRQEKGLALLWGTHHKIDEIIAALETVKEQLVVICPSIDILEQTFNGTDIRPDNVPGRLRYMETLANLPHRVSSYAIPVIAYSSHASVQSDDFSQLLSRQLEAEK